MCYYFSGSWCTPCEEFGTALKKFYNKINSDDKRLEIIFVSCDYNNSEFIKNFQTMPWLAIDYDDPQRIKILKKLEISTIPELVLVNQNGKAISKSCKNDFERYGEKAYQRWINPTILNSVWILFLFYT